MRSPQGRRAPPRTPPPGKKVVPARFPCPLRDAVFDVLLGYTVETGAYHEKAPCRRRRRTRSSPNGHAVPGPHVGRPGPQGATGWPPRRPKRATRPRPPPPADAFLPPLSPPI